MARILVVDDDPSVRAILGSALLRPGHEVDAAADGVEALRRIAMGRPDVVLADVVMPRMNGWMLLRRMRTDPDLAYVPVILLSGLGGTEERLRGFRLGADDVVVKPVHLDELRCRVDNALRHGRRDRVLSTGMSGCLSQIGLSTVLMMLSMERRTGELVVQQGASVARLLVREGNVVQASMGRDESDLDCVLAVLSWSSGAFELVPQPIDAEDRVGTSTTAILLEAARMADEAQHEHDSQVSAALLS